MSGIFRFQRFDVRQQQTAMKVGTDAVLLGALAPLPTTGNILEVGAGCGVISMMLAQRTEATIYGIEIDLPSYSDCAENFSNHWACDRLVAISGDFLKMDEGMKYDGILSNPPYFERDKGLSASLSSRITGRQQVLLSHSALVEKSLNLLTEEGSLAVILPVQESAAFTSFCLEQGLHLYYQHCIRGRADGKVVRIISCFGKQIREAESRELTIELRERHDYSPEYRELMRDFLFLK